MIGNLLVSSKLAKLKIQVHKFFCENSDYTRKIFTERCKEELKRFERLNELVTSIGRKLGIIWSVSKIVKQIVFSKIFQDVLTVQLNASEYLIQNMI